MIEQIKTKRALFDVHGVLLKPKPGQKTHHVDKPLTEDFLDRLQAVAQKSIDQNLLLSATKEVLEISEDHWQFLDLNQFPPAPYSSTDVRRISIRILTSQYFDNYQMAEEELENIKQLSCLGFKSTLYSGTPYLARQRFRRELNPIWESLDPDLSAILRPTDWHDLSPGLSHAFKLSPKTSSAALKTTIATLLGKFENVMPVEDDYYIALCLAGFCNIRVFMPIPENQARNQPHLKNLALPPSLHRTTNGEIIFNSNLSKML